MTREELKAHCERQIEMCEKWAIGKGEKPSGKIYEEHKLILELLEQEPKKGHWVEHGIDESYAIPVYTCSECEHLIGVVVSDFCPNCGADMRGKEV